ncbi:Apoptosis-inducing factor 1, mitochondrial [Lamellibrachia satsuma]|nr:Apoptosis-inducing factor 1, mitochondrial [Lamellibrachia satsuma]
MLRSGRCLYRLVPKTRGVSFVSRKKVPVTCLQTVRCMTGQGSSAGEQQDWSKAIVAGVGSTSRTKEVVEKVSPPPPMVVGLPSKVPYLIIGAGTAGFAAYRSIRSMDPKAQVLLIGEESYLPYMRPPLSKEMWYTDSRSLCQSLRFKQWNGKERSVFFEKEAYFCKPSELMEKETGGVSVVTGVKVVKLDVRDQKVYMNNGQELEYDKVLIATGGKPKNLPLVKEAGPEVARRCTLFRNVEDFRALDVVTQKNKSLAIIGGGFHGQ